MVVLAGAICSVRQRGRHQPVSSCQGLAYSGARDLDLPRRVCRRLRNLWATHFVAMLAYDPGAGAGYSIPVTLLSLLFAICIVAIGLCVALSSWGQLVVAIGGAIIGTGVAAMHYTGMAGDSSFRPTLSGDPVPFWPRSFSGSVFAAIAMLVVVRRDDTVHTLAAAGLLTVAIVSHHFTAMGAVTLVPDPTLGSDTLTVSPAALSFLTSIGAFAILGISLLAAMFDRAAKGELHEQKILLDLAITNMSQGLCMFDAEGRILLFNQRYVDLMDRTGMPLQGRLLIDVLREVKAVGEWDGDPDEFFKCGGGGRQSRQDRDQDDGPLRTLAPPNYRSYTFATLRTRVVLSNKIKHFLLSPFVALHSRPPQTVLNLGTELGTGREEAMAGRLTARKVDNRQTGQVQRRRQSLSDRFADRLPQMGPALHVAGQSKRNGTWERRHGVPCRRP